VRAEDLPTEVGKRLIERGWSVALAESCTGGLIAKRLTDVPGSSRYVKGGVVAYANDAKMGLLGVPAEAIRDHGAVSEPVARAMAAGVASAFGADAGLAVTGIAGPAGAMPGKPVGTVWFALALPDGVKSHEMHFPGSREAVRDAAANHALGLLAREVLRASPTADSPANP
jgi:PncC family amidohydrolase